MLVVKEVLADGHEGLKPEVLAYMKHMAQRHGFTVLGESESTRGPAQRIEINYPFLKDRVFLALLEEA